MATSLLVPVAICSVVAYLLGGIPFGVLVSRALGKADIRSVGSGNTGTTNAMRTMGVLPGVSVFLLDAVKGALAVIIMRVVAPMIAGYFGNPELMVEPVVTEISCLALLAVVLGHVFSPYMGFKGGKGIATAVGGILAFIPLSGLFLILIFALLVITTRTVSIGSIAAAIALVPMAYIVDSVSPRSLLLLLCVSILVLWAHRSNIKKLIRGEEKRFAFERDAKRSE